MSKKQTRWRNIPLWGMAGAVLVAALLLAGTDLDDATNTGQPTAMGPAGIATQYIELAWSGRYDEAFALTSQDLRISGGDAANTLYHMNPAPTAMVVPEVFGHAEAVLIGYFEYLTRLDTTPLSIECAHGGHIVANEFGLDHIRCTVVATNALLPPGQTYEAVFTMVVRENSIDAIGEVGHPYEGGDGPNLPHPPVEDYEALGAAVAPGCGGWRAGSTMMPAERPADREWWIALGRSCAQAWRNHFGA